MKRNRDFEKEKEILKRQQKHTKNPKENDFSDEMENEKIESLYVTREMAEDKEMDEKIRQDLIRAADEAERVSQEEEALGTSIPMGAEEKQQLFDDIVNELKRKTRKKQMATVRKKGHPPARQDRKTSYPPKTRRLCASAANFSTHPKRKILKSFPKSLKALPEPPLWRWVCLC